MLSRLDEISPRYIGEERIRLTLDLESLPPHPGNPSALPAPGALTYFGVLIDYSACEPQGVMLPLEVTLRGPKGDLVSRHYMRKHVLESIALLPHEGGPHIVSVREVAHNRWHGSLVVDVLGERVSE